MHILRCRACDHCFTDTTRLSERVVYDAAYFLEAHKNWFANPDVEHFELLRRLIELHGKELELVDVGCGPGNFLRHLRRNSPGLKLLGLDLIENRNEDGIDYLQMDFLKEDLENSAVGREFDVVVTMHTIEHIEDGPDFIARLRKICKPGGLIIITTPNERSILYRCAGFLKRLGIKFAYQRLYGEHHCNHYNFASLTRLCRSGGLQVIEKVATNIPMRLVDTPPLGRLGVAIVKLGVWFTFQIGLLTQQTYQQTIICRRPLA